MSISKPPNGTIMRLFDVRTKPGATAELLKKFATISAAVVEGEDGNQGYFFGRAVSSDSERVIFASVWADLDAVKARFGTDWQESLLPPGYEDLIESCSVTHFDLSAGWHVKVAQ